MADYRWEGYRFEPRGSRTSMKVTCFSVDELQDVLRDEIDANGACENNEGTTIEITLHPDATIPLVRPKIGPYADGGDQDLPDEFKATWTGGGSAADGTNPDPRATVTSINSIAAGRDRMIVQRAASRGILTAVENVDGYKYAFNNAWASKDDDGQRFSYICQDSMQNKDRHANGFTRTQKHLRGEHERGIRKPTFDCKGSMSVKYSSSKGYMMLQYRHRAIHPTIEARKSLTRAGMRAARASLPQADDERSAEGLVGQLMAEMSGLNDSAAAAEDPFSSVRGESQKISRSAKRKRDTDVPTLSTLSNKPTESLSLVDLLRLSEASRYLSSLEDSTDPQQNLSGQQRPAAGAYDLPSWRDGASSSPVAPGSRPTPSAKTQSQSQPLRRQSALQNSQSTPSRASEGPGQTDAQSQSSAPQQKTRASALFSTLKPTRSDQPTATVSLNNMHKGRSSCTNCRWGKKKCDEARPICGACQKVDKTDCFYEGIQFHLDQQFQQWPPYPGGTSGFEQGSDADVDDAAQGENSGSWFHDR